MELRYNLVFIIGIILLIVISCLKFNKKSNKFQSGRKIANTIGYFSPLDFFKIYLTAKKIFKALRTSERGHYRGWCVPELRYERQHLHLVTFIAQELFHVLNHLT